MKQAKNKKAVELNITTIVIVILAVLVLVVLALAFTGGMGKMWQAIVSIFAGTSGLEAKNIANQCNLNVGDNYYFCCQQYDSRLFGKVTCAELGPKISWADFDEEAKNIVCTVECQAA